MSVAASFNNGQSQVNFNFFGGTTGEYPVKNLALTGANWKFSNNADKPVTPDLLDVNGYPNVFTGTNPAGGYYTVFYIPSQTSRPGNYVITWTGDAGLSLNFTYSLVNGSLTASGGVGRAVISTAAQVIDLRIKGTSTSIGNLVFCHVDDENTFGDANGIWHPQFILRLKQAKFSTLRFLNWISGNNGTLTTWASRKPLSYFSYAAHQYPSDIYAGTTTNSGSDYSISSPSTWGGVIDKARISIVFNASCPTNKAATFTNGSANVTVTGHGQVTGNQAYLRTTGSLPTNFSSDVNYFVTVIDANTLNYSATNGGTAIVAGSTGSGTHTNYPVPTLSVGGATAVRLWNQFSVPYPQSFVGYPVGGTSSSLAYLVYDAALAAFLTFGGTSGSAGVSNGVPPETCIDLCATVGAHPWFSIPFLACDPATDFVPSLATYLNSNAPSWMVPRIEPPNELWNTAGTFDTQYANAKALAYGWGSDYHNWYGKVLSILGQAVANVYGVGNLGITYRILCGVQTVYGVGSGNVATHNPRLNSAKFISSDPQPLQSPYARSAGYNWFSDVCVANYFKPPMTNTVAELQNAFAYNVTNAGNASAQAANLNTYVDTLSVTNTATFTNGQSAIAVPAHGLTGSSIVVFLSAPAAPFNQWQYYWVTVVDANTIRLAASSGGSAITATAGGSATVSIAVDNTLAQNAANVTSWKAWGNSFGPTGKAVRAYEGGYTPDYVTGDWSTSITGATQANPCVVTLGSTSSNAQQGTITGNPAVVGMAIQPSSVGGMTQLNLAGPISVNVAGGGSANISASNSLVVGQVVVFACGGGAVGSLPNEVTAGRAYYVVQSGNPFQISTTKGGAALTFNSIGSSVTVAPAWLITAVNGSQITLDLDASGFSAYTSGGTATWAGSKYLTNTVRGAAKSASNLFQHTVNDYAYCTAAGLSEPSMFQLGGWGPPGNPNDNVWSVLGDIYQTPDPPQWVAVGLFNARMRRKTLLAST